MAYFNIFKIKTGKIPIPDTPPYVPPTPPTPVTPESGSIPSIPMPTITGGSVVSLYQVTDEKNKLNKTLGTALNYTAFMVVDEDIRTPILEIESATNITNYNYAYIDTTQRYYFVKVVCMHNGYYRLILTIDPLMSFKTGIGLCYGVVKKCEDITIKNKYLEDNNFRYENGLAISIQKFAPSQPMYGFFDTPYKILVCGGL